MKLKEETHAMSLTKVHPVTKAKQTPAPSKATAATAQSTLLSKHAIEHNDVDETLERKLLPQAGGQPPNCVQQFIDGGGGVGEEDDDGEFDEERQNFDDAVGWLKLALAGAYRSKKVKRAALLLLGCTHFVGNLEFTGDFDDLKDYCRNLLNKIGKPLQAYFDRHDLRTLLGRLDLPTIQPQQKLRQDLVGVVDFPVPPSHDEKWRWFEDESVYIHALRLVAAAIDAPYQTVVADVIKPFQGQHMPARIKGDARMRNKALASEDHRHEHRPRPALNIDINRCCAIFNTPGELEGAARALCKRFGGAAGRVKNGFALDKNEAGKSFHYRSLMLNLVYEVKDTTYGDIATKHGAKWDRDAAFLTQNPEVPWELWCAHQKKAVAYLKGAVLASTPVVMVCEVQLLLVPYLAARKEMHLLYKVVRASTSAALSTQFLTVEDLTEVDGVKEGDTFATWSDREAAQTNKALQEMDNQKKKKKKKKKQKKANKANIVSMAFRAVKKGHVKVLQSLSEYKSVPFDPNWTDKYENDADEGSMGCTLLQGAIRENRVGAVQWLMGHPDIDPNQQDDEGRTALLAAGLYNCDVGIVRALINHSKTKLNLVGDEGEDSQTPITVACEAGNYQMVRLLLENTRQVRIDLNKVPGSNKRPPFLNACQEGFTEIAKMLIDYGGETLQRKEEGEEFDGTGLTEAVAGGRTHTVAMLLRHDPFNKLELNWADENGETALITSSINGHKDIADMLLAAGATETLFSAAIGGRLEQVKTLIKEGNTDTNQRLQPLAGACKCGHLSTVDFLLSQPGMDPNTTDTEGLGPLHCACEGSHVDVVRLLLQNKNVDINLPTKATKDDDDDSSDIHAGLTPLHVALQNKSVECVKALLERPDLDVNALEKDNDSPMDWCAVFQFIEGASLLIANRSSDIDIHHAHAPREENILIVLAQDGQDEILRLVLDHPSFDPNTINVGGAAVDEDSLGQDTALFAACQYGHTKCVQFLLEIPGVNVTDGCFHEACSSGYEPIAQLLFGFKKKQSSGGDGGGCGFDLNFAPEQTSLFIDNDDEVGFETAVFLACENGHHEIVEMLIEASAQSAGGVASLKLATEVKPGKFMSALCAAAHNGNEKCLKLLLALPEVSTDRPGRHRDADIPDLLLNIAVRAGQPSVVKLLLQCDDPKVEQVDCYPNDKDFDEISDKILLLGGPQSEDVDYEDEYETRKQDYCGQTSLECAMAAGTAQHAEVVKLLESYKVKRFL